MLCKHFDSSVDRLHWVRMDDLAVDMSGLVVDKPDLAVNMADWYEDTVNLAEIVSDFVENVVGMMD